MNDFDAEVKAALYVDKNRLDDELIKQAALYQRWSEQAAFADTERYSAKENLDLVTAEIDYDIRTNPTKYGFDAKLTEAAIKNKICTDERYIKANERIAKAREDYSVIMGVVESINHKKMAIENLVKLYLAGYWCDPKTPRQVTEEISNTVSKQITEDLNKNR